jgi:WD repeat-containing protein 19
LEALCTNDSLYKLAAAGEGCIKIYNMLTWKEIPSEKIELPPNIGKISKM